MNAKREQAKREQAKRLLKHYLRHAVTSSGGHWDSDNDAEVDDLIDCIIDAAVEEDALYGKRGLIAPDPQDYSTLKEFEEAEELYIYRRDAAAGMSLEEWRAYTKDWGKDTDEEAEARTDYADPLN